MADIRKLLETLESLDPETLKENMPEVRYEDIQHLLRAVDELDRRLNNVESKLGMNY